MKKNLFKILLILPLLIITGCKGDDVEPPVTEVASKQYMLEADNDLGITGTTRIIKNSDGTSAIEVSLEGVKGNAFYASYLYLDNAANEGQDIVLTLDLLEGDDKEGQGKQTTLLSFFDDGSPISYEDLLEFDGYIGVNSNDNELTTMIAKADIGQNELTDVSKTYNLVKGDLADASGVVTFTERLNGEALAEFNLIGTPEGKVLKVDLISGAIDSSGDVIFNFNDVDRLTGTSITNIELLNGASGYTGILGADAHIEVSYMSEALDLNVIVVKGNIGVNAN